MFRVRRAELWLGTLVDVAAEASSAVALESGVKAAFGAVERVHRALSAHDHDSELSRVNRSAVDAWQRTSCDLRVVLDCALEVAARSRGTFDPTIGGDMAALGFLPQASAVASPTSWRDVERRGVCVRFSRPLALDLGGIAKGYAVDCAIAALRDAGVERACVNAGGDLRVLGDASEIVHVRTGGRHGVLLALCAITDGAVATSAYGDQRKSEGGRFATPLIDPRVRLPVMSTRTVSVVAPTCMIADALTKVVLLRGARAAPIVAAFRASAAILSPAAGRWRCTYLPRRAAA